MEWLVIAYVVPAALILAVLSKFFASRSWRRWASLVSIAALWPLLAVIIFWPFSQSR